MDWCARLRTFILILRRVGGRTALFCSRTHLYGDTRAPRLAFLVNARYLLNVRFPMTHRAFLFSFHVRVRIFFSARHCPLTATCGSIRAKDVTEGNPRDDRAIPFGSVIISSRNRPMTRHRRRREARCKISRRNSGRRMGRDFMKHVLRGQ